MKPTDIRELAAQLYRDRLHQDARMMARHDARQYAAAHASAAIDEAREFAAAWERRMFGGRNAASYTPIDDEVTRG